MMSSDDLDDILATLEKDEDTKINDETTVNHETDHRLDLPDTETKSKQPGLDLLNEGDKQTGKRSVRFSDSVPDEEHRSFPVDRSINSTILKQNKEPDILDIFGDREVSPERRVKPMGKDAARQRPHTAGGLRNEASFTLDQFLNDNVLHERSNGASNPAQTNNPIGQSNRPKMRRPLSLDSIGNNADTLEFPMRTIKGKTRIENENSDTSHLRISELEAKVKRLQMELTNSASMLELLKQQHREEISVIEQASKSKLEILEESSKRRENRLKDELQFLEQQNHERFVMLEQQRDQLISELSAKLTDSRGQGVHDLNKLKSMHDEEVRSLKSTHENALKQIRDARLSESHILDELQPNTETLKRLLQQLHTTSSEFGRVEQERTREAIARQEQLARKEELARVTEDRLNKREEELDTERKQVADSMARMEIQIRENVKLMSEDRWSIKQEHNRLTKLQIGVEEERRSLVEQAGRERAEIQNLVTCFLAEHRKSQAKNADERAQISHEYQHMRSDQLTWDEKRRSEEASLRQNKEEMGILKETLTADKRRLDERANTLRVDEVKLDETRRQLEIVRCDLVREQETLDDRSNNLAEQTIELTRRFEAVSQAEKALSELETRQKNVKIEHSRKLAELQTRAERLHEAEKNLITERRELSRQHAELTRNREEYGLDAKMRVLCGDCRMPVREKSTPNQKRMAGLIRNRRGPVSTNQLRVSTLGDQVLLSRFRDSQDEDSAFLEEEKQYLQRIKQVTNEMVTQ